MQLASMTCYVAGCLSSTATTCPSAAPPACPFTGNVAKTCRRRRRSRLSCNASLDRRDVLLGLAGVAAAGSGAITPLPAASAATAGAEHCTGTQFTVETLRCALKDGDPAYCTPALPTDMPIFDFTPPPLSDPIRERLPAHLVDAEYIAKYEMGIGKMMDLPSDDPRNFWNQAAIHNAYCSAEHYKYTDGAGKDANFNVHSSWIFAPWHRMYVYFFERILADQVGDPSFALPYWNWDVAAGMALPAMYKDNPSSKLYNPNRQMPHLGCYTDLDYIPEYDDCTFLSTKNKEAVRRIVLRNHHLVNKMMFRNGANATLFHGARYCAGDPAMEETSAGSLEAMAHNAVHMWTGDRLKQVDMGNLSTAARDPVFYAHHANVDRLWNVWRSRLGHADFDDAKWLDTSFVFFDEKKRLVRTKVRDVLDPADLRYIYAPAKLDWLNTPPQPVADATDRPAAGSGTEANPRFPLVLDVASSKPVRMVVDRPPTAKPGAVEVLVIENIEFDPAKHARFDVLVNVAPGEEYAVMDGPGASQYAGAYENVPQGHGGAEGHGGGRKQRTNLRLGLRELLDDIDCAGDDRIYVTLVPSGGRVVVGGVRITYIN